jgi:branched-chain amino acid transport system permease protein
MFAFLLLLALAAIPFCFFGTLEARKLDILTSANLIAILAVSWDLLVGRTGQISLGHALFYGAGAYSTAILFKYYQWPFWVTIPLSLIVGVGVALLIGIPCLRFKGPYLALLTMAFPISILGFLYYFREFFGGETGITVPRIFPGFKMNFLFDTFIYNYYLSLALLSLSALIIYKLATSKTGIVFVSILDDELGAKACGINITKYKLLAIAISGLFGSLAGAFAAHMTVGSANPRYFLDNTALIPMEYSIIPIVATILGGIGTIYGPIIGTYIYYLLFRYVFVDIIKVDPHMQILIFIALIVSLIIKWPRGIVRTLVEKLEDLQEPREIEEIEKERHRMAEES